ncbi:afli avfa cytochrome p450 monooxygenase [Phlyctema vagabunda]|uniref:Afli avfa cytochrome p450 monooxygenase n=1 Tax=Phlyctema vagabunda TaxID=108571 RepID=A0ABR4P548_9HELO
MSKFAILGATGATGQQIVRCLLQSPDNSLHLYVRSRSKLLKIFPGIQDNDSVHIFEGSMNDIELVASCIASTKAVFSVLASNDNTPGMTIARDSAATILSAFRAINEKDRSAKLPRVVVLSSASVNAVMYQNEPWYIHFIVYRAFWHVYKDLENAERLYAEASADGTLALDVRFIHPGALIVGDRSGKVNLSKDKNSAIVTYGDLALGMVQAGENSNLEANNLGITVAGNQLSMPPGLPLIVLQGLLWTYLPWLHQIF